LHEDALFARHKHGAEIDDFAGFKGVFGEPVGFGLGRHAIGEFGLGVTA